MQEWDRFDGDRAAVKLKQPRGVLQCGFTLSELLVVVAVVSITLAYAVPMFLHAISDNRRSGVQTSMISTLTEARTLALGLPEGWYASVVPGSGSAVTAASSSTYNWSDGWRVITVPYIGAAGSGSLGTSGMTWVGATASAAASQVAATAPADQVTLGYTPTTTSGIQVQVYSNSLASTSAPTTTLTRINFDNNGNLVDSNGNIMAGQAVIIQACDLGLKGQSTPVPGLGLVVLNTLGSQVPVPLAGPLPAYTAACP